MENINEIVLEEFPIKDRSSRPGRRKKTYFKGKQRYELCKHNLDHGRMVLPKSESVTKGMLRKTNVMKRSLKTAFWNEGYLKGTNRRNHNTNKRLTDSNDKMNDYAMED